MRIGFQLEVEMLAALSVIQVPKKISELIVIAQYARIMPEKNVSFMKISYCHYYLLSYNFSFMGLVLRSILKAENRYESISCSM